MKPPFGLAVRRAGLPRQRDMAGMSVEQILHWKVKQGGGEDHYRYGRIDLLYMRRQ
jgi:hypothetical protein